MSSETVRSMACAPTSLLFLLAVRKPDHVRNIANRDEIVTR